MKDLEIGMYVRYNGKIGKYIQPDLGKSYITNNISFNEGANYGKYSYNIIDLIENKDLCEIEFYSLRYNERVTRLFEVEIITDTYINFKNARCEFLLINKQWNSEDLELKPIIKTILTKEQFENNCYKIGD